MKRMECSRCGDYQEVYGSEGVVRAWQKPVKSIMKPVYLNRAKGEGKGRFWMRVGFVCERCGRFTYDPALFKPKQHSV